MYFDKEEFKEMLVFLLNFGVVRVFLEDCDNLCHLLFFGFFGICLQIMLYFMFPVGIISSLLYAVKFKQKVNYDG